jgi:predicted Rossmann-fold nucleotide-binding protein
MRELTTIEQASDFIQSAEFQPAAYRNLDLRTLTSVMVGKDFGASLFLGCELEPNIVCQLASGGAYLIHDNEQFSFPIHRSKLYTADELFRGFDPSDSESHLHTLDNRIYLEYVKAGRQFSESIQVTLARRLHDHSITEALGAKLAGRKVVAIMGGHGMERRDPRYIQVAQIARLLTQKGFLLVSGGGPGAMEATHVGAFFATRDLAVMQDAIKHMSVRPADSKPNSEYSDPDWLHRAWRMREAFGVPEGDERLCESVGIPTWTYGHEPPAIFASHIGKYFANSVREDGLLTIANHGVIFAPGSAGTIQEIFQEACQNHYFVVNNGCSPMVLFGKEYWTKTKPVWPLLAHQAEGRMYGELLDLTDSIDTVVRRILTYQPELYIKED